MTQPNNRLSSLFELEYPQSVGIYDSYPLAQAAVDHLADAKFAVENLAIVGTDLKSVERVTGRRNWGTVLITGLQSGVSTGLMVTFILWFLQPQTNPLVLLPGALLIGILIGIIFAAIVYATSRGKRDFNSISQTVAAKYEVLCEHKVAGQARELLAAMPGARAAAFDPRNQPAPWQPQGPQGQYPQQAGAYGVPQGGYGAPGGYPSPDPGQQYGAPQGTYPAPGGQPYGAQTGQAPSAAGAEALQPGGYGVQPSAPEVTTNAAEPVRPAPTLQDEGATTEPGAQQSSGQAGTSGNGGQGGFASGEGIGQQPSEDRTRPGDA